VCTEFYKNVSYCLAESSTGYDKRPSGLKYLEKFLDRLRALESPEKGSAAWNVRLLFSVHR